MFVIHTCNPFYTEGGGARFSIKYPHEIGLFNDLAFRVSTFTP